nr:MAG TPA: hypothetical protein [Bacteriophage sp.]
MVQTLQIIGMDFLLLVGVKIVICSKVESHYYACIT